MNDKEITPEESLKIIQGMINAAKHGLIDNGFHFMLWGVLVALTSITHYALARHGSPNPSWLWLVMTALGIAIALTYEFTRKKRKKQSTNSRFGLSLFMVFLLAIADTWIICSAQGEAPIPFILVLMGISTMAAGIASKFTPFILGGIIFFVAGAISPFLNNMNNLLLLFAATTLGYIIPGIMLWEKGKN